jgi:predicted heme/steroid binding protein
MPLKDAAAVLGVSKDAVRQRVRRDTLRSDKGEDGRVYVYLDASVDDVHGPPAREAGDDPLHQQMQARIDDLREQLRREQDAHEQTRRLLGGALERIPAIEAPASGATDERGPHQTVEEEPGRASPRPADAGPQTAPQRPWRPWWRRMFGN